MPTAEETPAEGAGGGLASALLWNLGSAALPLIGSFVVSLLLAPHLGPERFGHYLTAMTVASLVLIVAKFGVHAATSRLVTENMDRPGSWIRAGLVARGLFTLPCCLLALLHFEPELGRWQPDKVFQ